MKKIPNVWVIEKLGFGIYLLFDAWNLEFCFLTFGI